MTDNHDNPGINVPPPLIYVVPLILGLLPDKRSHVPFLPRTPCGPSSRYRFGGICIPTRGDRARGAVSGTHLLLLLLLRRVNGGPLMILFDLQLRIGAQPQRDVGGLHGLFDHPHQIVAQCVEVGLVSELGGEGF